ncbi:MAG: hypothetical protein AAF411_12460 [Myxococcota bacterium]
MGWDITFFAEFPSAAPACERFRHVWEAVERRDHESAMSSFKMLQSDGTIVVELGTTPESSGRATAERLRALLRQFESEPVCVKATWRLQGRREDLDTLGGVTVTVQGPEQRAEPSLGRDVDLIWDVGDSRRTTAEGSNGRPSASEVLADAALLTTIGAKSIWGVDANRKIVPEYLYAVFHRDLDDYRSDGFAHPAFAPHPVTEEHVLFAAENLPYVHVMQTDHGPFLFTNDFQNDRLSVFYAGLGGILLADYEEESSDV